MDKTKERRRYIRTETPVPVIVRIKQASSTEEIQTQLKNISATGIMAELSKKISPGVSVDLILSPQGIQNPIHIKATVVRSDKSKTEGVFNTGIEFIKVEEDNKNTFLKFLCDIIYKL